MSRKTIFQYAIIWNPTAKQAKDEDAISQFILEPTTTLAKDANSVQLMAAMEIPQEYKTMLDQIDIVVRPF